MRVALTQGGSIKGVPYKEEKEEEVQIGKETNILLTIKMWRTPTVVEMEILGCKIFDTIVDGGSGVNILFEETWKAIGKPTHRPPTFQLVGIDQHEIKPIGTLTGQKAIIGTQHFLLDFIIITLEKKGYDVLLGRGWLVAA